MSDVVSEDPFERVKAREAALRERRSRSPFFMAEARWFVVAFLAGWAGLLLLHWTVFAEPRWLAIVHLMVYGVVVLYVGLALVFLTRMSRRHPEEFGLD